MFTLDARLSKCRFGMMRKPFAIYILSGSFRALLLNISRTLEWRIRRLFSRDIGWIYMDFEWGNVKIRSLIWGIFSAENRLGFILIEEDDCLLNTYQTTFLEEIFDLKACWKLSLVVVIETKKTSATTQIIKPAKANKADFPSLFFAPQIRDV